MNATFKQIRDCVVSARSAHPNAARERLMVIIAASEQPKEFWDRDMKELKESGAVDILRRILTEGPPPPDAKHEFFRALAACPNHRKLGQ